MLVSFLFFLHDDRQHAGISPLGLVIPQIRQNGLLASIEKYYERLLASERRVAISDAQKQADGYSKHSIAQQLKEYQTRLEQKLPDDFSLGWVDSLYEEPNHSNDINTNGGYGGGEAETWMSLVIRFLSLDEGTWLLLLAFGVWLFL